MHMQDTDTFSLMLGPVSAEQRTNAYNTFLAFLVELDENMYSQTSLNGVSVLLPLQFYNEWMMLNA